MFLSKVKQCALSVLRVLIEAMSPLNTSEDNKKNPLIASYFCALAVLVFALIFFYSKHVYFRFQDTFFHVFMYVAFSNLIPCLLLMLLFVSFFLLLYFALDACTCFVKHNVIDYIKRSALVSILFPILTCVRVDWLDVVILFFSVYIFLNDNVLMRTLDKAEACRAKFYDSLNSLKEDVEP
ncbi:hypothetical protein [Hutsoniella sourekii]